MDSHLGHFVSERRKALGLTQQNLADYLSCPKQALAKFESGRLQLDLALLPKLSRKLRLSLDDLIHEAGKEGDQPCGVDFSQAVLDENLVYLRKKSGLTQEQAAKALGISKRSLINYENGQSQLPAAVLKGCCDLYEAKADDLVGKRLTPLMGEAIKHKRWSAVLLAPLLAVFVIGGTSAGVLLSQKGRGQGESESSLEEIGNLSFSSVSAEDSQASVSSSLNSEPPTSAASSETVSWKYPELGLNSFRTWINSATAAITVIGTSASIWIEPDPADWYHNFRFSQVQWEINREKSSAPDGAEIQYLTDECGWALKILDTAPSDGMVYLDCYILDKKGNRVVKADNELEAIFHKNGQSDSNEPDCLDSLTDFYPNVDGQTEVKIPPTPNVSYEVGAAYDPVGWDSICQGKFTLHITGYSGSRYFSILDETHFTYLPGVKSGDKNDVFVYIRNIHTGKELINTHPIRITVT
jgi:transcriptional regulator with XRE-family HTH domain